MAHPNATIDRAPHTRRPRWTALVAAGALLVTPAAGLVGALEAAPAAAQEAGDEAFDRPLLRLGDTGQAVAAWQRHLNMVSSAGLAVDGVYGTTTEDATAGFQAFFGLRADGIVGERTRGLMRILLEAFFEYTPLAQYDPFEVVGYQSEAGYCVEARAGDDWNVECSPLGTGPIGAQSLALADREVLYGSVDPISGAVQLELTDGTTVDADLHRDVAGTDRALWTTSVAPSEVAVIRAVANDGSEIRRIVLADGDPILVLERGDRGPAVEVWQTRLNELLDAGLAVDGVFGRTTESATRTFQSLVGIQVDGIVGPQTREAMTAIRDFLAGL